MKKRHSGSMKRYAYDAAGNMLEKVKNSQKIAMTYDAANELKTMTASNGTVNYAYDVNGNLTQKTLNTYTDTYSYNVKNQLTSYSGYDGYQQRYSYNAQGHMTKRESKGNASRQTLEAIATSAGESAAASKEGGSDDDPDPYSNASSSDSWSTTTYVYDVTAPYYEVLSETTSGTTTAYDYGVERLSAYSGSAWSKQKTEYVYDGRGSVAQTLTYNDSWYTFGGALAKKTVESYSYTPFGEIIEKNNSTITSNYAYNGESYDSSTGMVNLRARWYEPAMMRFNQRDLLKGDQSAPLSLNRYLYCENDSVNFVDPSGKSLSSIWNSIKSVAANTVNTVAKVATNAINVVKTVASTAVKNVATVATTAANVVQKVSNTVRSIGNTLVNNGIKAAINETVTAVKAAPSFLKSAVTTTTAQIKANNSSAAQIVTAINNDTKSALTSYVTQTKGDVVSISNDIRSTVTNGLNVAGQWIGNAAQDVGDWVVEHKDAIITTGITAVAIAITIASFGAAGPALIPLAIAAGVGGVAGLGGQFIGDVLSSTPGSLELSSWQEYVGSFVGGAFGGVSAYVSKNPAQAGAISGFISNSVTDMLNLWTDPSADINAGSSFFKSLGKGGVGWVLGKGSDMFIKIPGITSGSGNYAAVFKAGISKLISGSAETMSGRVIMKGIMSNIIGDIPSILFDAFTDTNEGGACGNAG